MFGIEELRKKIDRLEDEIIDKKYYHTSDIMLKTFDGEVSLIDVFIELLDELGYRIETKHLKKKGIN
jgi:tRNA G26 N,N-dimethylase Trm1